MFPSSRKVKPKVLTVSCKAACDLCLLLHCTHPSYPTSYRFYPAIPFGNLATLLFIEHAYILHLLQVFVLTTYPLPGVFFLQICLWLHASLQIVGQMSFFFCDVFWEKVCVLASTNRGEAKRERERIPSQLDSVSAEPTTRGLDVMNRKTFTWVQIKRWMLNPQSHRGAPQNNAFDFFKFC